jgi:hypothetical protein
LIDCHCIKWVFRGFLDVFRVIIVGKRWRKGGGSGDMWGKNTLSTLLFTP